MIRIARGEAPNVLTDENGAASREHQLALAHYENLAKRKTSFKFDVYKHPDVKTLLNELFHGKCAYCESRYGPTAPVDIEHFRPKAAVVHRNGALIKPGYYWLASAWDNLLPSCIDCNRRRTHPQVEGDPELSGKANLFPIAADKRTENQMLPGIEKNEGRHLLHPCRDRPEVHLCFRRHVLGLEVVAIKKARGPSRKGIESIRVYGLNRQELVLERGALRDRILLQAKIANETLGDLAGNPTSEKLQQRLADRLRELLGFCDPQREYAAAARVLVARAMDHFDHEINLHLGAQLAGEPGHTATDKLMHRKPEQQTSNPLDDIL